MLGFDNTDETRANGLRRSGHVLRREDAAAVKTVEKESGRKGV